MPTDPWILALLRFGALALIATAFGLVLRMARCPGGRPSGTLLGGVIAGVLLGPGVLGAVVPDLYERVVHGSEARELANAIDDRQHQLDADLVALAATGVSAQASDEQREQGEVELADLRRLRQMALDEHALPMRQIIVAVVSLVCVLAMGLSVQTRATPADLPQLFPSMLAGLAGGSMALLAVALIGLKVGGLDRAEAIAVGAAVAGGTLLARFPLGTPSGVMRPPAMTIFGGSALFVAMMGMWWSLPDDQAGWLIAPVLTYLIASTIRGRRAVPPQARRFARPIVLWLCVAPLTALLISMVDLQVALGSGRLVLLMVLVGVVSGSAFWLGAWLAFKARGTQGQRDQAALLALDGYAQGVICTRVLALAMLMAAGALDPSGAVAGAIVLGAILGGALDALILDAGRAMLRGDEAVSSDHEQ